MSARIYPSQQETTLRSQLFAFSVRYAWLPIVLVFGALLLISLFTLMRLPVPFVDEGWNANRSWALLHTGIPFGTLDSGVFERYPGYWTYFPLLASSIHAAAIALLGPTLFAMRMVSFLFGAMVLLAVYIAGKKLYGNMVGTVAVIITALSVPFVLASHIGRHDIVVTALGYWAFVLYISGDPTRLPYRSFLAGLAIGLTLDIHPNGIVFAPAIALLYFLEYGWRAIKKARFWAFVGGGLAGLLWFVGLHLLQYPGSYFTLFSLSNGTGRTPPASDPFSFATSLIDALWLLSPMTTLLCLVGLAILLYRRSTSDTRLAALFLALVLAYAGVVRGKPIFYEVLLVPATSLVIAALIRKLWALDWPAMRLKVIANATVWGLIAASTMVTLVAVLAARPSDFDMLLQKIRAAVPPGASIMGAQTYYFALPEERYLSWEQLVYYRRAMPGSTMEDALRAMHPDYLLFDSYSSGALVDDDAAAKSLLSLPRGEFDAFVNKYATVTTLHSEASGDLLLYKIDWSR